MTERVTIRPAQQRDVAAIATMVNEYAAQNVMLPRTPESIALAIDDFLVAVTDRDRVIGCGSLKEYSPSLAEIAALAVTKEAQGRGVGRAVVERLEKLALSRGIESVFALTLTPPFFESLGYAVVDRSLYPEKIRRDCVGCPRRFGCGEVTVGRTLRPAALEVAA